MQIVAKVTFAKRVFVLLAAPQTVNVKKNQACINSQCQDVLRQQNAELQTIVQSVFALKACKEIQKLNASALNVDQILNVSKPRVVLKVHA